MLKNFKKRSISIIGLFGVILGLSTSIASADVVEVESDKTFNNQTSELFLNTKPETFSGDMKDEIETNIESDRLKIFSKDKNTPQMHWNADGDNQPVSAGSAFFATTGTKNFTGSSITFDNNNYQNKIYGSYSVGWRSISFDISNIKATDYITIPTKNVGWYQGRSIDAKVTYKNIKYQASDATGWLSSHGYSGDHVFLDVSENLTNGYVYSNIANMTVSIDLFDSETGTQLEFSKSSSAYFTFNSLNNNESVNYLNVDTSTKTGTAYVNQTNNISYDDNYLNQYSGYVYHGNSNDFEDEIGAPTFVRNSISFVLTGKTQNFIVGSAANQAWNTFNAVTLFKASTMPEKVSKTVQDINGNDINKQSLTYGETAIWNVKFGTGILGQTILVPYTQLKIEDTIDNNLTIKKVVVQDDDGNDVTNQGTLKIDGQKITFTFSNNYLEKVMKYDGSSYHLVVTTTINDDVVNGTIIYNKALVTYDNQTQESDKPEINVLVPQGNVTIQKLDKTFSTGVANTKYHVTFSDGSLAQDVTTGADGTVTISDVTDGVVVTAVETSVPAPYVLNQTPFKATVKSGETVTMKQTNIIQFNFPRTGSTHLLVSSVAGLFLFGFAFYFYQKNITKELI